MNHASLSGRSCEDAPSCELSIILPIFNERENIIPLLDDIENALIPAGLSYEILAIDDGSSDGSAELLTSLVRTRDHLKYLRFRRNCGQSAAFDAGFRHAAGRRVVTMDADRQNDPADIPRMLRMIDEQHLDLVCGRRANRRDKFIVRKVPSRIANSLIRLVTRTRVRDLGCSLKAYRSEVVKPLRLYGEMHRFIPVLVEGLGARIGEMDVNHRPRVAGVSKYGIMRTFKVLLDLVTVWFMRGFQTKPIYVFGGMGLLLMGGAMGISGLVLWQKFADGVFVHRNPLFILSMVMAIMAVQFLALGLIAEMMIRTYYESQDKPTYLIAQSMGFETKPSNDVLEMLLVPKALDAFAARAAIQPEAVS